MIFLLSICEKIKRVLMSNKHQDFLINTVSASLGMFTLFAFGLDVDYKTFFTCFFGSSLANTFIPIYNSKVD